LLIKYIKSVLWRVAKRLSYIEDARCLKVKQRQPTNHVVESSSFFSEVKTRHFKYYLDKSHQKLLIRAKLHESEVRHLTTCITQWIK